MRRTSLLWITAIIVVAVSSVTGTVFFINTYSKQRLMVSTTTSLFDTGLLDTVETRFEACYPIDLCFISVGTGLAITQAKRGDTDLILIHSPAQEHQFLTEGYGLCRKIIAYNHFAIIGPSEDPAGIARLTNTTQALTNIVHAGRHAQATWISRGDDSGTHTKEKQLWTNSGYDPQTIRNEPWYLEASAGMGGTLKTANQFQAYTLTDMGTYLAYASAGIITLKSHITQAQQLLNVYSAIATNPTKNQNVNFDAAITFLKYLISLDAQQIIADYGKDTYGQSFFNPAVALLKQNPPSTTAQWIKNYAFFQGYECPPEYWDDHPELYQ